MEPRCKLLQPVNAADPLSNMAANTTMKKLELSCLDQSSQAQVDILCRLNAAGRSYMHHGACRVTGIRLLAQVFDDLDAVYVHLLEHPSLVVATATEQATSYPVSVERTASKKESTETPLLLQYYNMYIFYE